MIKFELKDYLCIILLFSCNIFIFLAKNVVFSLKKMARMALQLQHKRRHFKNSKFRRENITWPISDSDRNTRSRREHRKVGEKFRVDSNQVFFNGNLAISLGKWIRNWREVAIKDNSKFEPGEFSLMSAKLIKIASSFYWSSTLTNWTDLTASLELLFDNLKMKFIVTTNIYIAQYYIHISILS